MVYASAFPAYCFPKFVSRRYNGRFYCVYGVHVGNGKYNDGNFHCNKCIKPDIYQMDNENRTTDMMLPNND